METEKIDAINSVIVINHDREEGYRRASEDVKDEELKRLFLQFSNESARFSEELRRFGMVVGSLAPQWLKNRQEMKQKIPANYTVYGWTSKLP